MLFAHFVKNILLHNPQSTGRTYVHAGGRKSSCRTVCTKVTFYYYSTSVKARN